MQTKKINKIKITKYILNMNMKYEYEKKNELTFKNMGSESLF